ncbi:hypothetical protein HD806DRAFT_507960 [Xylariaceae sp. AK1471]|nr:hypothetical protein HD806DRAFT_507960 [Xylariaceae sp. AK1471]
MATQQLQVPQHSLHSRSAINYDDCPDFFDNPPHVKSDYFELNETNTADPALVACCAPNPVQSAGGCYVWCEVPAAYGNDSANAEPFGECLKKHGRDYIPNIKEGTPPSAGPRAVSPGVKSVAVLGIVLGWYMML